MTDAPTQLSATEAAIIARVTEVTIRRYVAAGQLPARRVAGRLVIDRADLDRFLEGEPVKPRT